MSSPVSREALAVIVSAGALATGYIIGYFGMKWYVNADQPQKQIVSLPLEPRQHLSTPLTIKLRMNGVMTGYIEN
jgi:F0F1-type ATP synthase membrane subunit a